ncbi:MAG: phytoene/squalene synthase family protein [Geminicoccaceae bacterium]
MPLPGPEGGHADADDRARCAELLRHGSKTFYAASKVLPPRLREPATILYAFCRLADDAADLDGGRPDQIASLRGRLLRIYEGRPLPLPVDRALADVVIRFSVPSTLLDALFEGFEWDAAGRRYDTLADLHGYAARVAGTVGAMMCLLMDRRAPETVARACELGIAMQLTNIARDVGEDARAGRLYLPRTWLTEAGIDPEGWLARPTFSPALASVIARLLEAADETYRQAEAGIAQLPVDCRRGIWAARLLYAEIGAELGRQGLDSVAKRAVVPFRHKARLLARALAGAPPSRATAALPPLPAAQFLVDAVLASPAPPAEPRLPPWWNFDLQVGSIIELLERVERRREVGGA